MMRDIRVVMLLLAVVTLVGLIVAVEPEELVEALEEVELLLLLLAALLYLLNLLFKVGRWRVLITTTGARVPYLQALRLFLCGLAVNNTTPGGMGGEPLKAWLLRHEQKTSTGEGLATIFGERLMDLTLVIVMSITGLWFLLPRLTPEEGHDMVLSLGLLATLLVGFLVLALHPRPMRWTITLFDVEHRSYEAVCQATRQPGSGSPEAGRLARMRGKLVELMCQFDRGLTQIRAHPWIAAQALGITLVIWLNASLRYGVLVLAVTGDVEAAGLIMMAAGITFSVGQFLPLGVGNVAVTTLILTTAGIEASEAAAIGLLEVATSLTLSVPLGLVAMGLTGEVARMSPEGAGEEPRE